MGLCASQPPPPTSSGAESRSSNGTTSHPNPAATAARSASAGSAPPAAAVSPAPAAKPEVRAPSESDIVMPAEMCHRDRNVHAAGSCLAVYEFDLDDESSFLGEGASGKVVRGHHRRTGREVAVKVMIKKKLSDEDIAAVAVEVDAMHRTKGHPHVVTLEGFFDEPGVFYLVIEVVAGGELFTQLSEGAAYTEAQARESMHQLVSALEWCHRKGVVHRDLKPENILLTRPERSAAVKVADFGFAKTVRPGTRPLTTPCGTPAYVAPEILKGRGHGLEADVWSLGVLLFILLCGEPPFYLPRTAIKTGEKLRTEGEREREMFRRIRHGIYVMDNPVWKEVSPEAVELVKSMLTVSPDRRPTLKQVMKHPWWSVSLAGAAPLVGAQKHLRVTNGRRKLKKAFNAALVTARLRLALGGGSSTSAKGAGAAAIAAKLRAADDAPDGDGDAAAASASASAAV